ncbi:hypothetical protein QC764_0099050 [Podospora pseudoanserina]|uniref:Uncharacterized protein n=1 Tax=Podospora pseudoanserina TaxID=2609844 RepID=A0ABR0HV71_9PEZI|nr:hypothetical protein QC764_0099050 [Podospora pseudoanserina]
MASASTRVAEDGATSPSSSPSHAGVDQYFIAIGIDFGTTYSGVSWTRSNEWNPNDPRYIYDVMSWPGDPDHYQQRLDEAQVPTLVDPETGAWGYHCLSPTSNPIRWFKLLLLREGDAGVDVRSSKQLIEARSRLQKSQRYQKTGLVGLIADFLRGVWEHALEEIGREVEGLDGVPLKAAIATPAMWPEYANKTMIEAAQLAGITDPPPFRFVTLSWVQESEAAALCTLREKLKRPVKRGETFMVCDCGGGTIDIITYTTESVHPLRFREAVEGAGKLCGAFLIDQAFENHITIGNRSRPGIRNSKEFRDFVDHAWEYGLKRNFHTPASDNRERIVEPVRLENLPRGLIPKHGLDRLVGRGKPTDIVSIERAVVEQWFSASYTGIRFLIGEQLQRLKAAGAKSPSKIFLVGGLGSSRYLHSILNRQFNNILQVRRTWSAVARGATMAVLEGISINSRVVRQSYGIQALVPESGHNGPRYQPLKDEMYIGRDGVSRMKRMLWYFKEGDRADSNGTKVSHRVFIDFDSRHNTDLVIEVCLCNSDNPPPRKDKTVKPMCRFRCPMRALECGDWQKLVDDEGMVTRIRLNNVMLSMIFDGELRCMLRTGDDHAEFELEMEPVVESEMEDGFEGRCRIGFL